MFGTISSWLKKRVDDVEGAFGRPNAAQTFRTNVSKAPPAQTVSRPRQATVTQPQVRNFTDELNKVTQPKFNLNQSLQNNGVVPQQPKPVQVAPQPKTTQQLVNESYGTGLKSVVNKGRDLFDPNTQADQIKRRAQTGLNETYQQEQARKTQSAIGSKGNQNAVNQFAGAGLGNAANWVGKAPGAALNLYGAAAKSNNLIVKTLRSAVPGMNAMANADRQVQGRGSDYVQSLGQRMSKNVENKVQQSSLGDRTDQNKWARTLGKLSTDLPLQLATGGAGLANTGGQMASDEYDKARAAGKSNDTALGIGTLQGGASALSEKFGIDRFLPGNGAAGSALARTAQRFLTEGAQEAQQQFTQNLITNKTYNPNQSLVEGVPESFVLGGVAGSGMSGVSSTFDRGNTNIPQSPTTPNVRQSVPRPEEFNVLSDYQDVLLGNVQDTPTINAVQQQARQAAERIGVDITSGSVSDINNRINEVLSRQPLQQTSQPTQPVFAQPDPVSMVDRMRLAKQKVLTPLNKYGGSNADFDSPTIKNDLTGQTIPNPAYMGETQLTPAQEIQAIQNKAYKSRGGKLTITEENRIAELLGNPQPIALTESKTYTPGSKVEGGQRFSINDKATRDANARTFIIEEGGDKYTVRIKEDNRGDVVFERYDENGNFMDQTTKDKLEKSWGELSDEKLAEKSVYGNGKAMSVEPGTDIKKLASNILKEENIVRSVMNNGIFVMDIGNGQKVAFGDKATLGMMDGQLDGVTEYIPATIGRGKSGTASTGQPRLILESQQDLIRLKGALGETEAPKTTVSERLREKWGEPTPQAPKTTKKAMSVDPLESLKQEAKRFGYDKGYTEEGQIANTIDELMKEQNAVREVGIPLYDKYKGKLDGTKTVTGMMTPAELEAYRVAETKSERASKLLKDYFDYKKAQNQAVEANQPQVSRGNLQDALQPDTAYSDMLRGIEAQAQQPHALDAELTRLERQKQQIIDAEARAKYEASRQLAQDQKDLRKTIRASGGIGLSDYETLPSSLKRKNGRALDDLAAELGFENDQALVDELTTHTQPERLKDLREVVEHEMKNGKSELSGDYKNLLKAIDDRHAELLRYPEGAKVVKNTQGSPSPDEFNSLLSTPEAQSNSNKTKQAVTAATADLRKQQFDAVVKGDLDTADQVRKKIGEIETGLKRTAPEVKREIETVQPVIKSIKDKAVREKFVAATKGYLGTKNSNKIERQVAIRNLENKYKLSEAEKLNAIQALDSSTVKPANDNVASYVKEFRSLTDSAYKQYRESGVSMGYQSSYLPRIYQNPETGQMYDSAEFELLQRGSKRMKGREADKVNTDWLVERDPTKLLERYYDSMDKVAAGQKYMKDLQNAGLITASTEPVPGLRPIVAEGMQNESGMTYYAPKQVADKLNTMFGSKETTNLVEKVMEKGSGINSLFQGFVLSGGIPNTPINSFGMMQVMKEAMTLHPVKAGRAIHAGFSKKFADKYFTSRKDMIKLMAENDVDIRIDLSETGKSGWQRTKEAWSDSKAKGLNRGWDEITNDSTFKRFMPMLEVVHFENMYKKAYKKTGNQAEAARIAADSVKNFYGKTGEYKQAVRSKLTNDAMGAALFAPRFRESMVNFWGKNIKALNPKNMTKLEYRDNVKFMAASAFTFAAMNALNEALNGVNMWDNPDDKKDKLIIPADKVKDWTGLDTGGKDVGVPFLSSIATVPRNAALGLSSALSGDFESASKRAKSFLSMPLNSAGDLLTNEDYFGNKIVSDDVKGLDRFTQMASYTAGRNMQPWVREGLNKLGGNLPDDLKKRLGVKEKGGFETAANALESPLRFYDPRYYKYDETWTPRGGKDEKFTIQQQRERSKFKADIDKIPDTLQLTNPQKQAFKALNTYEFDNDGNLKLDNDPFYQAKRATALQDDGVFEAMKQKNIIENKLNGKPIDPIYELPSDARRIILWKKTLPQGTSDPTIKQIYNQEWYQDYRGKEDQYFRSKLAYNDKMGYGGQKAPDTNPYPEAPPELQKKLDYYYTLPSGTGARSNFLRSNPDILAQWDRVEDWKNGERAMVGLGPIDSDNKYASGGKRSGGRKSGAKLAYKSTDTSSISKKLQQLAGVKSSGGGSVSAPKKHTPRLKGVRSV